MDSQDRRVFGTLFFSIFTAVTGVGIVVPLLPVYARNLGAGGLYIGAIFGAFSLSRSFFLPWFGRLSDRHGRKPYIAVGLLAYALVSTAFLLASDVETLIGIRFVQGISSAMIMPVVQAYVGDITPPGREGTTMGLFNLAMFLGLSAGPVLGGVIVDQYSLQAAFACMGILSLGAFGLSVFLLPPRHTESIVRRQRVEVPWRRLLSSPGIMALFLYRLAYAVCIGIMWSFLPLLAHEEFHLPGTSIGILVMLGVLVSGLLHYPMGLLADRVSRRTMMAVGGLTVAAAVVAFEWVGGFWDLFAASIVFGIGGGIAMPAIMALCVVEGHRTGAMGSVMGLVTMAHSLGMLTGAVTGGLMMDHFTLRHGFSLGGAIMAAAMGGCLFLLHRARQARPSAETSGR